MARTQYLITQTMNISLDHFQRIPSQPVSLTLESQVYHSGVRETSISKVNLTIRW